MKMGSRKNILKSVLFIAGFSLGIFLLAETINFIENVGMDYGIGFDTLKGVVRRRPLFDSNHHSIPGGGQRTFFSLKKVEGSMDLEKELNVSVSGSYGCGLWHASAQASFMKSNSLNTYSLYYMVSVKVTNAEEILSQDPQLTQQAKDILNQPSGLTLFNQSYGDSFVSGITTGGEYYGIVQIDTKSDKNFMDTKAKIEGGGIGWDFKAQFAYKVNQTSKTNSVNIKEICIGDTAHQPASTADAMTTYATGFAGKVLNRGVPVFVELAPYTVFPEYASKFTDLDLNKRILLAQLQNEYLDYQDLKNNIDYVRTHSDQFRFNPATKNNDVNNLTNQSRTIADTLTRISFGVEKIADRVGNYNSLADLGITTLARNFAPLIRLPKRYKTYLASTQLKLKFPDFKGSKDDHGLLFPLYRVPPGDGEMAGHPRNITVNAAVTMQPGGQVLMLGYNCTMREDRRDWTTFSRNGAQTLLDLRFDSQYDEQTVLGPGLRIKRIINTPASGSIRAVGTGHDEQTFTGSGILNRGSFISDSSGNEDGKIGATNLLFNDTYVELQHEEDFLNLPYDYQNAAQIKVFRTVNTAVLKRQIVNKQAWKQFRIIK